MYHDSQLKKCSAAYPKGRHTVEDEKKKTAQCYGGGG